MIDTDRAYMLMDSAMQIMQASKLVRSVRKEAVLPPAVEVGLASVQSTLVTLAERVFAVQQRIDQLE